MKPSECCSCVHFERYFDDEGWMRESCELSFNVGTRCEAFEYEPSNDFEDIDE